MIHPRKLLSTLVALTCCLFLACSEEDDIQTIFASGEWNVSNFYGAGRWDKVNDDARPIYTEADDLAKFLKLTVRFSGDGTLQGTYDGGTFTAHWQADGGERTIGITALVTTGSTPAGMSAEFIRTLREAAYYKGDSNYLKLAPADKKSYLLLGHWEHLGR